MGEMRGGHSTQEGLDNTTKPNKGRIGFTLLSTCELKPYHAKIETRNLEEIPYSSRIVPKGVLDDEGP